MDDNDPRKVVWILLNYLGVTDADLALECDKEVCRNLIINLTVCEDYFQKFLRYMRS